MNIKKVGVVGCGLMGAGIAQVAAQAGYDTIIYEHVALTKYRE
jgi:3-hydroxybutyryl-CoA dehydrogenase